MDTVALLSEPITLTVEDLGLKDATLWGFKLPERWTPTLLLSYTAYIKARMNWNGLVVDETWKTPEGETYHTNDERIMKLLEKTEREMSLYIEVYEMSSNLKEEDIVDSCYVISPDLKNKIKTEGTLSDVLIHLGSHDSNGV